MNAAPGKHPKRELLHAFGLGKLDDASATLVNQHLETCVDCQRQVAEVSGDSLLDQLRKANGPAETPAPGQTLSPLARAKPKAPEGRPPNSVPPELANNAQYEILRELGAGGMGVVYLAKNKLMDRLEVLKVISTALLHKTTALDRFLQEIRAAASLSHDNVVKAYSALQFGELLVFAMEYVDGDDLAKVVKTQGALPITNACFYARQVALGLQHAHEKNMVHRDIKPHNLILARVGKKHTVKILDFGLAKASSEKKADFGLTGEGKMLGTPDYMAPEQSLDAAAADIRADIYSLGCTLYFLLTGTTPFNASSLMGLLLAHQNNEATALNLVRADIPVELAAIVAKMMAKEPGKRFKTPLEVAQALTPFITKAGAKGPGAPSVSLGGVKAELKPNVVAKRSETFEGVAAKTHVPAEKPASAPFAFSPTAPVSKPTSKKAPAKVQQRFKPFVLAGIAAAVGVLFLGLLLGLSGVIFRVPTKDGVLVVEVDVPNPDVYVDGEKITVSWDKGGKKAEISVKPGMHKVEVKKDGFTVQGGEVELKDGGSRILNARFERISPSATKLAGKSATSTDGFVPLFNGKDLTGWSVENGDPSQWTVEGGSIVARCTDYKARNYLLSAKEYTDFTIRLEVMIESRSGGGIGIRSIEGETLPIGMVRIVDHPLIKLVDHAGFEKEWSGTTHWVKDDKTYTDPLEKIQAQIGIWHKMEITVRGRNCTASLAGTKIVDLNLDPDSGEGAIPALKRTKGKIGFQAHTGTIRFRRIEIKELTTQTTDGFVPLFNGKDLTGWKTHPAQPGNWRVENGILTGSGSVSHLFTERGGFKDFHLRAELRVNEAGNSGIYFRSPFDFPLYDRFPGGYEAQICHRYENNQAFLTGSLQGHVKAPLLPLAADEWFSMEIIAIGNDLTVKVNNKVTAHYVDEKRSSMQGHFALQVTDPATTLVQFRKIEIKELTDIKSAKNPSAPEDPLIAGMKFVRVPKGTFWSGGGSKSITQDFEMAAFTVTQGQWQTVMGNNPSWFCPTGGGRDRVKAIAAADLDRFPVENVSWEDVQEFLKELNTLQKGRGWLYRLPTRLEWEYGCRGGPSSKEHSAWNYYLEKPSNDLSSTDANFNGRFPAGDAADGSFLGRTTKVGSYRPNELGLFDMHGNVWQLCADAVKLGDGRDARTIIGGAWDTKGFQCRVSDHAANPPSWRVAGVGFRLARERSFVAPPTKTTSAIDGFVPLFNGKDLSGWEAANSHSTDWVVRDGTLVGKNIGPAGPKNVSFLITKRSDYANFHLRVKTMICDGNRCNLAFRVGENNAKGGWPNAYLLNLGGTNPAEEKQTIGSITESAGRWRSDALDAGVVPFRWFEMELIAEGRRFKVLIDGKQVLDCQDITNAFPRGRITLQCRPFTVVKFEKFEIKELKASATVPELINVLRDDKDAKNRLSAVLALGQHGKDSEPAIPLLVEKIVDTNEDPAIRKECAMALARIGPVAKAVEIVPTLLKVLTDKKQDIRARDRLIWALRVHGENLRNIPGTKDALIRIVKEQLQPDSKNKMLRYDAAYMLGVIWQKQAPTETLSVLNEFLHDDKIKIYVATDAGPSGTVNEKGKGDGRIMALDALQKMGASRYAQRPDIMKQLCVLAADKELYAPLQIKASALVKAAK